MDEQMQGDWWDLEQLVQQANARLSDQDALSVRNVRRLVSEGALSAPVRQGRNAYYTQAHLEQLLHVRTLMSQGFTVSALQKLAQSVPSVSNVSNSYEAANTVAKGFCAPVQESAMGAFANSAAYALSGSTVSNVSSPVYASVDAYVSAKNQALQETQSALALSPKLFKSSASSVLKDKPIDAPMSGQDKAAQGLAFLSTLSAPPLGTASSASIGAAPRALGAQGHLNSAPAVYQVQPMKAVHIQMGALPVSVSVQYAALQAALRAQGLSEAQWENHCKALSEQVYQALLQAGKESSA